MKLHAACSLCLALFASSPATAGSVDVTGVVYGLQYTPAATLSGSPIEAFSFSFQASTFQALPGYITGPGDLSFALFSLTDGSNSGLIGSGQTVVDGAGKGCFVFLGPSSTNLGGCGAGTAPGDGTGLVNLNSPFPTAPGVYSVVSAWDLNTGASGQDLSVGNAALTVSGTGDTLINFQGGSPYSPILLPSNESVSEVMGEIGGQAGSDQFYQFLWPGGQFLADGLVDGSTTTGNESYGSKLQSLASGDVVSQLKLTSLDGFEGSISPGYLAPGEYEIGLHDDGPGDPSFSIIFASLVPAVPEPGGASLVAIGFVLLFGLRALRS
jgi:hypothetical protein